MSKNRFAKPNRQDEDNDNESREMEFERDRTNY